MIHDTPSRGSHYTKWLAADDTKRQRRGFDCRLRRAALALKNSSGDVTSVDASQRLEMTLTARGIALSQAAKVPPPSALAENGQFVEQDGGGRGTGLKKEREVTAALLAALFAFNLTH